MNSLRTSVPFIATLFVSLAIFLVLAMVDDRSAAARASDTRGLSRGLILDRRGSVLAMTRVAGNGAVRRYTLDSLAPVVGYRDPYGRWHGIEAAYSSFLDGTQTERDWHSFFLRLSGRQIHGGTVRLTIDSRVQRAAARALGTSQGAVVALDPRTGAVLALASGPSCSPNVLLYQPAYTRCQQSKQRPLLNRATSLLLPPGSSFKIVTLTAALDSHRFHLTDHFSGKDAFGPSPYFNNSTYPSNVTRADLTSLTLPQALAFSDNFVFAHIGLTVGAQTLLKYAQRYRVGRSIPFNFPVLPSAIAGGKQHPTASELAQSAFGAEVDRVTPLQMALIAETVANGGVMMAPHLVQDLERSDGKAEWQWHNRSLGRVMVPTTARDITTAMIFVVQHGSGFNAQIKNMAVAGKTGTAASGASLPHAWFISFAPARHPVVAVAVLHEFSGEGFKYAAPIARQVLIAALRARGYSVH